ncbi:molybdate ABC transporter substrate-binding protein [Lachnospiraceae bacterium ZAX-1]
MKKRVLALCMAIMMIAVALAGCGNDKASTDADKAQTQESNEPTAEDTKTEDTTTKNPEVVDTNVEDTTEQNVASDQLETTEIYVFIAKSLSNAMDEVATLYQQTQPNVSISYNADSSGTLQTQIEEGFECDLFFSAAAKQTKALDEGGFLQSGSIVNLLGNKLCLISYKGSGTTVTGFDNISNAASFALADGSVPVGQYTRALLVNMGVLELGDAEKPADITTDKVKEALNGIEINECANVGAVTEAVKEAANEIGTVYYSDAYSVKDDVDIIAEADQTLLGDPICYPVALVNNKEADELQTAAAKDFYEFLLTDECMGIFQKYMFTEYVE